jgi:hypothetical protein
LRQIKFRTDLKKFKFKISLWARPICQPAPRLLVSGPRISHHPRCQLALPSIEAPPVSPFKMLPRPTPCRYSPAMSRRCPLRRVVPWPRAPPRAIRSRIQPPSRHPHFIIFPSCKSYRATPTSHHHCRLHSSLSPHYSAAPPPRPRPKSGVHKHHEPSRQHLLPSEPSNEENSNFSPSARTLLPAVLRFDSPSSVGRLSTPSVSKKLCMYTHLNDPFALPLSGQIVGFLLRRRPPPLLGRR